MHIGLPQMIVIGLAFMDLGIELALNKEEHKTRYNFVIALISKVLWLSLLYWGGFFG